MRLQFGHFSNNCLAYKPCRSPDRRLCNQNRTLVKRFVENSFHIYKFVCEMHNNFSLHSAIDFKRHHRKLVPLNSKLRNVSNESYFSLIFQVIVSNFVRHSIFYSIVTCFSSAKIDLIRWFIQRKLHLLRYIDSFYVGYDFSVISCRCGKGN